MRPGWDPVGIWLGSGWDLVGIRVGSGWDPVGIWLGSGWDLGGIRVGSGWDLDLLHCSEAGHHHVIKDDTDRRAGEIHATKLPDGGLDDGRVAFDEDEKQGGRPPW